jgi:3-oxoacyl-[acyl-carrier protein] reductase
MNALVTGASRGIGRAAARALAERGMRVALHYHTGRDAAEEARASLPGGPHVVLDADLAHPDRARDLFADAVEALGRVEVLVNNAGIFESQEILTTSFEHWRAVWDRTIATNLLAPSHLMYFAAHHMAEQGGGRIVNVSSRGAFRGEPKSPAYGASKAGLNAAGQSFAKALGRRGVLVFTVAPGWVETDMARASLEGEEGAYIVEESALGRVASAEEVARTIAFLALDAPESMTGCIVDVNGASYLRT